MSAPDTPNNAASAGQFLLISPVPDSAEALLVREAVEDCRRNGRRPLLLVVARDDAHMRDLEEGLKFFLSAATVLAYPAWDCLPFDRVSPITEVQGRRLRTLAMLAASDLTKMGDSPIIVLTTVNGLMQRTVSRKALSSVTFDLKTGGTLDAEVLNRFLVHNGYIRTNTVNDPGEYAFRGGIIDLFPTGQSNPVRIDLFGDEVESIKRFDALTQKSIAKLTKLRLFPVSEVPLDPGAIERFRKNYRKTFNRVAQDDPLYEAVSAGRHYPGMEHWLPLFYDELETLTDFLPGATILLTNRTGDARQARSEQIADFYDARQSAVDAMYAKSGAKNLEQAYFPVPWQDLYLTPDEFDALSAQHPVIQLSPFSAPPSESIATVKSPALNGLDFAETRNDPDVNLYEEVRDAVRQSQRAGRRVVVTGLTTGSRTRLASLLRDAGLEIQRTNDVYEESLKLEKKSLGLTTLPFERGFQTDDFLFITEQDILGERLARPQKKKRKADQFLTEATGLEPGDLVVHMDHGIGRFDGLMTMEIGGAAHDVLRLLYHNDDKLYLPVENIEMLSRYGNADSEVPLDKLGGVNWQARKAKLKKRLKSIADELIKIAARRALYQAEPLEPMEGAWDEFCARFPYAETEDQLRAIEQTLEDMASGKPMDRLVCGDVGFGKTEVALRAAFVAAMTGRQVAVVVPTTLLSRQHTNNFTDRFKGFPIRIAQLSRMVSVKEQNQTKKDIEAGQVDIVIGTHALLAESLKFKDLGLLVIDEEQKFGVKQKERLKKLRETVHVLTLSATPIPRTLQLAMSGVKELSLIATPPVDRLAVRTFVMPWDPMVIREALMREQFRGGQSFVVCPRLRDQAELEERLKEIAPELKLVIANGQMAPSDLEQVMSDFYDHKYDVLLATNIVESGLDIPSVNTLIVHRADMFGLSSLYQLRGRVGRAKQRGYAYLTMQAGRKLTPQATRRLEVMSTLDSLGAGFSLASHDLDIRGAGNLVGEEQSGHIREVGIELYQQMLEEAVRTANRQGEAPEEETAWSPKIELGLAVSIPDTYVPDLPTRLGLYRRMGQVEERKEVDAFAAELIDRFGDIPEETQNLLKVLEIKRYCRLANIERVEAGEKGAIVGLRNHTFAQPDKLMAWIKKNSPSVSLRNDQKIVYRRQFLTRDMRVDGVTRLVKNLAALAKTTD